MQSEEDLAVMKQDLAFLDVVQNAELSEVERLIKEGQEVNVGDENGNSACHKALEAGTKSMTVIQLLVQNGAFIDYNNAYDERPIHMAIKKGELARSTLEYLIGLKDQAGKRVVDLMAVDRVKGNTLLHEAAWHGNEFACTCLLQTGAFNDKLETCNKQGQTVMHLAAFRASKEFVEMLVAAGADKDAVEHNTRRISRETPMEMASAMGRDDTAEYLRKLQKGTTKLMNVNRLIGGMKN